MNARTHRLSMLKQAHTLVQQASQIGPLTDSELLEQLYALDAGSNWRSIGDRAHSMFLDVIVQIEPVEQPEIDAYPGLPPATLDKPIEHVGSLA